MRATTLHLSAAARREWATNQSSLGITPDGLPGPATAAAVRRLIDGDRQPASQPAPAPAAAHIPRDTDAELIAAYGPPGAQGGRSPDLVPLIPPYPMRLSWSPYSPVARTSVHRLAHDDLMAILTEIGETYNADERKFLGLDLFGGIYNPRRRTGGGRMSTHAWGIAIDIDIARNRYGQRWRPQTAAAPGRPAQAGDAWMPLAVVQMFERRGWVAGARWRTADAMHFQRAR
jgi:hypothetical protein